MEGTVVGHARFFSRLAHMIPSDLYNHTESMLGNKNISTSEASSQANKDGNVEEVNNKYFKHKKQPLTADEKKGLRLERKKRKYEPDQDELEEVVPSSNTQAIQEGAEEEENSEAQNPVFNKDAPSANLDDLRKRLQERIAHMRDQRQTKKPRIEDGRGSSKGNKKESAAGVESSTTNKKTEVSGEKKSTDAASRAEALQQELLVSNSRAISEDVNGLEFNAILQNEADISEQIRQATKKKEGGKVARLQRLLKEAEKKRERLTTLMSSGDEEMQAKARAEQWNDVLTVAAGGKALLVSTIGHNAAQATTRAEQRIKKALKKREKKKEKSAKEWNERLRTVDDEQKARLDKRDENIKQKKQRHLGKASKEEPSGRKRGYETGKNVDQAKGKPAPASAKAGFGHRAGFEGKKSSGSFLNK
jgi:hypothetical protein